VLNLTIEIVEDAIYSYPKQEDNKTTENWSIEAVDTNNYTYKTSKGDTSNMRIYIPIVLIISKSTEVKINISATGNYTFNRQSIGLYKINNVDDKDILKDLVDLKEQVYLYHKYMKIIADMAENYDTDKVK
jgi:hypothetical protein